LDGTNTVLVAATDVSEFSTGVADTSRLINCKRDAIPIGRGKGAAHEKVGMSTAECRVSAAVQNFNQHWCEDANES
jgi:hypothetical protein